MNRHGARIWTFFYLFLIPGTFAWADTPEPVEWVSPLSNITDLNLDLKEIEKMIEEDGQFIFRRDPKTVTYNLNGEEKTYENGVIVTAMTIVCVSAEKAKSIIANYSIIGDIQPQHTNVKTVKKKGNHVLYSYNQVYKMGVITLNSDFLVQQTMEENGSISTLLIHGDVDAQIQRWEFIPLDKNRTLLVLSFWAAYDTARFAFKILLSVMAESHLIAPVMFCAMYLEQYSEYIEKNNSPNENAPVHVDSSPATPAFIRNMSDKGRMLIESLVTKGTVHIRTTQYTTEDGKPVKLPMLTTFDILHIPFKNASPFISDISNMPEAIPILKSIRKKNASCGNYLKHNYRIGKFPILIPLFIPMKYDTVEKNIIAFENPGKDGAYAPFIGSFEWDKMHGEPGGGENATLYIYTHGFKVGPSANLYVRTLSKLMPDSDNVQMIFSAIIFVEGRIKWIERNYQGMLCEKG